MTEELEYEPNTDAEPIVTSETFVGTSEVPIESAPEQSLAAVANAVPAAGGPIVVDPYAILGHTSPPPTVVTQAPVETQPYVAPTQPNLAPVHPHAAAQPGAYYGNAYQQPGYPAYGYGQAPAPAPVDGFAIAAIACGVAGLILWAPVIGSILGLIFGIVGLNRIKRSNHRGRGLAIAGIATGAVGLLFGLFALIGLINWANYWVY